MKPSAPSANGSERRVDAFCSVGRNRGRRHLATRIGRPWMVPSLRGDLTWLDCPLIQRSPETDVAGRETAERCGYRRHRKDITEGEFDNHFDGVVSAIFHIADAVELVRTGVHRRSARAKKPRSSGR